MICSHLNPGSVMHMFAGDLENLHSLVTSRTKDAHVHIGVDATSARTTTITHRPEKTETPRVLHHGTPAHCHKHHQKRANMLTCNYRCRHEPQQIDNILSSDVSPAFQDFRLIRHGFGPLGIDGHNCTPTQENTMEKGRQETNRMGMP